jgi:uncharacterized membrane protein YjjB (DUF3815 family)
MKGSWMISTFIVSISKTMKAICMQNLHATPVVSTAVPAVAPSEIHAYKTYLKHSRPSA